MSSNDNKEFSQTDTLGPRPFLSGGRESRRKLWALGALIGALGAAGPAAAQQAPQFGFEPGALEQRQVSTSALNVSTLLSIAFADKRAVCSVLRIEFTSRVRYSSHFPLNSGDDLRISLRFLDPDEARRRGFQNENGNVPKSLDDRVQKIELNFERTTGPELRILFSKPTEFQVSQGAEFTSIYVALPDREGADCGPDLRREITADGAPPATNGTGTEPLPELGTAAVVADAPGLTEANRAEMKKLVDDARTALTAGDNRAAIRLLTRATQLPANALSPDAQELLGLARERNGQLAHAKAEYQIYLERYPESPGARRVDQRLAALLTAREKPFQAARGGEDVERAGEATFEWGGSISQFYSIDSTIRTIKNPFTGVEEETDVNQNELQTTIDLYSNFSTRSIEGAIRFTGSQVTDFTEEENHEIALSEFYLELRDREGDLTTRVGRQSRNRNGVFGRFDGALAAWRPTSDLELSLVGGLPVDDTENAPDPKTWFIGASVEFTDVFPGLDVSLYSINQWTSSLDDRKAVGAEATWFDQQLSVFGNIEYDVFFGSLNRAFLSGSYTFDDQSTVSWSADYRNAPALQTRNALQGQIFSSLEELRNVFTDDEIYQLAKDRTAKSVYGSFGFSRPLDEQFQISIDASISYFGSTEAAGGVDATQASGPDYYVSTQLIGTSVLTEGDLFTLGLRYADTTSVRKYGVDIRTRFPVAEGFRITPRVGAEKREGVASDFDEYAVYAQMAFDYALSRDIYLEAEFGARSTWRTDAVEETQTYDGFALVGYRVDF